ncbi:hypothetical protein EV715DRAFT_190323 [Schizophyllum commune]
MTYIQEELAYETGFQYPPNQPPQAALPSRINPAALSNHPLIPPQGPRGVLTGEGRMASDGAEMPFSFPQYPFNMESGFEMPSMADYQAALQDPRLMQGGGLDDTTQGVFALGTNMMSMADGTSNSFDSAQWTQYLGVMAQDGVASRYNDNQGPGTHFPYGHAPNDPYNRRGSGNYQ